MWTRFQVWLVIFWTSSETWTFRLLRSENVEKFTFNWVKALFKYDCQDVEYLLYTCFRLPSILIVLLMMISYYHSTFMCRNEADSSWNSPSTNGNWLAEYFQREVWSIFEQCCKNDFNISLPSVKYARAVKGVALTFWDFRYNATMSLDTDNLHKPSQSNHEWYCS